MGGDPGTGEEDLYCGLGEMHIHLLLDTLPKDRTTWNLSLRNLSDISRIEEPGCEESKGMTYEEYLFLMLALQNTEQLHYRMLDIMQLNIQEDIPEFRIENCVVEFEVQVTIQENDRQWHFQNSEGYLSE